MGMIWVENHLRSLLHWTLQ